jgi:hypothetical protein
MQGKDVQNIIIIIRWLKCILVGRKMLLGVGNTGEEGRKTLEKKGGKVERFIAIRRSAGLARNKKCWENGIDYSTVLSIFLLHSLYRYSTTGTK